MLYIGKPSKKDSLGDFKHALGEGFRVGKVLITGVNTKSLKCYLPCAFTPRLRRGAVPPGVFECFPFSSIEGIIILKRQATMSTDPEQQYDNFGVYSNPTKHECYLPCSNNPPEQA